MTVRGPENPGGPTKFLRGKNLERRTVDNRALDTATMRSTVLLVYCLLTLLGLPFHPRAAPTCWLRWLATRNFLAHLVLRCFPIASKIFSAVIGRSNSRTPTASSTALAIAAGGLTLAISPIAFAS